MQVITNYCNALWAKYGLSNGGWTQQTNCDSAKTVEVGGDTQVLVDFCGAIYARSGVGNSWTQEAGCNSAKTVDVGTNGRQVILDLGNAIWAKDGIGWGGWAQQSDANAAISIAVG